jgi:hypothetical protein
MKSAAPFFFDSVHVTSSWQRFRSFVTIPDGMREIRCEAITFFQFKWPAFCTPRMYLRFLAPARTKADVEATQSAPKGIQGQFEEVSHRNA